MNTLDKKISTMKKSQSIVISESNGIKVTCERSGKGDIVRFVRHEGSMSRVFKTSKF